MVKKMREMIARILYLAVTLVIVFASYTEKTTNKTLFLEDERFLIILIVGGLLLAIIQIAEIIALIKEKFFSAEEETAS